MPFGEKLSSISIRSMIFVAAPEGKIENRNFGTSTTEEFITTIDGWVFAHQAGSVKEWVAGAIRIIASDSLVANPSPPVGPVQKPSHSP